MLRQKDLRQRRVGRNVADRVQQRAYGAFRMRFSRNGAVDQIGQPAECIDAKERTVDLCEKEKHVSADDPCGRYDVCRLFFHDYTHQSGLIV